MCSSDLLLSSGIEEEPPPNEDGQVTEKEQGYAEDQVYFVEDSFPDFSDLGYSRDEISLPQESNPQSSSCDSDALVQKIPPRNENALSGTDFVNKIRQDSGTQRDELIVTEILNGNVPNHLRKLYPVEFSHGETSIQICVSGDYLAVGSDDDFVRFPLGLPATYRLFEHLDFILPTTAMVDQIYHDADHKLAPSPKKPGLEMETTSYIFEHNEAINSQVDANVGLIAGHKKDVVLSNRLLAKPQSIAIYGWHRPNGKVIQPLSTVHHKNYADYSHGIRLISNTAFLNGKAVHLRDLLQDSLYAELINPNEGPTSF